MHALVSSSLLIQQFILRNVRTTKEKMEREKKRERALHHNPEKQARKLQQARCNNLFKLYRHLRRPQ